MKRKTISVLMVITILMCIFSINVGAERKVLSFSRESISLFEDQSFQLDLNSDPDELRYSSTDPDIATVNSTGKVTAVSFGTSVITATDIDGNQAHCSVNVLIGESPDRVTVNTQSLSLRTGESFTLEDSPPDGSYKDAHQWREVVKETIGKIGQGGNTKHSALRKSTGVPRHKNGGNGSTILAGTT